MKNNIRQDIHTNQSQKLLFSLAMQESLKILQLGIEELYFWLEEKVTENPLFEWGDTPFSSGPSLDTVPEEVSCFTYLMKQARLTFKEKKFLDVAEWIIGNLDETGFYTLSPDENPFTQEDLTFCLQTIQEFDPPGIAASCLQESLLLQLKRAGKEKHTAYQILQEHLDDLIHKRFSSLQKKTSLSRAQIQQIITFDIAPLDPFPGYRFQKKSLAAPCIDVVLKEGPDFEIKVQEPTLKMASYPPFFSLSKEEKASLNTYQKEVKWILNALEKRKNTLYDITNYIVLRQKAYLEGRSRVLAPLTIAEISQELHLHESTVTRAISHKNLSSSLGIIPLEKLLSKGLAPHISCDQAHKLLNKLIHEEDKKNPLSDRELLEKMLNLGVPCARRTITKYRQQLKIPSKAQRKES